MCTSDRLCTITHTHAQATQSMWNLIVPVYETLARNNGSDMHVMVVVVVGVADQVVPPHLTTPHQYMQI